MCYRGSFASPTYRAAALANDESKPTCCHRRSAARLWLSRLFCNGGMSYQPPGCNATFTAGPQKCCRRHGHCTIASLINAGDSRRLSVPTTRNMREPAPVWTRLWACPNSCEVAVNLVILVYLADHQATSSQRSDGCGSSVNPRCLYRRHPKSSRTSSRNRNDAIALALHITTVHNS